MNLIRRLTLSVGVVVSLVATLAIASVGAAGGFGQGAGTFTFTDTAAFANFFNPANNASINASVDHGTFMFRARAGGPLQTQAMTVLNVSQFIPDPNNRGGPPLVSNFICLVIPDSDFVVSSDLQTATLNAVNQSTLCPGFLVPVTGAAPDGKPGPGGGGGGFTLPLTVTAAWTGTGLTGVTGSEGNFRCGGFVSTTHTHSQSALSSAVTATISGLGTFSGPFFFGNVNVNETRLVVAGSGMLPTGCGGGKGGGG
jgi:hypothetical protein